MRKSELNKLLPKRKPDSHKGDYGRVLLIGGSSGMSGAVILAGRGALRIGAGLVYLAVPKSIQDLVDSASLETITIGLAETKTKYIDPKAIADIQKLEADVIAVGPGLSLQPGTPSLVKKLLLQPRPLVIDADGLNGIALSGINSLKKKNCEVVLTPHPGEMARLLDTTISNVQKNRIKLAKEVAAGYGITLVLKGHNTVVSDKYGSVYVNKTGNPGMATGGVGDVLTGMIAGLIGQKLGLFDAAKLAVYLHGLAGDLAAKSMTQYSLIASDIIAFIPEALKRIKK